MAEDEVTDLTEEDSPKSDGKQKKEKTPKRAKGKKEAGEASDQPTAGENGKDRGKDKSKSKDKDKGKDKGKDGEKKSGGIGIVIIMLLVILILLGAFVAALYFDFFSSRAIVADFVRDPLLDFIIWLDPTFSDVNARIQRESDERERLLDRRDAQLDQRETDLEQREDRATTLEEQLNRRAFDLDNRETQLLATTDRTIPKYKQEMSQQELEDIMSLSRTYTQMSPEDAATIMVELYNVYDVASILYFMTERNRGPILTAFEPEFAAEVTNVWLYN